MSLDPGLGDGGGTSIGANGIEGAWSHEVANADVNGSAEPGVDAAFKLQVEEGATVSATFPFFGEPAGSQLSFQIGDNIQVLQKDELWSWGKLEKSGEEGWFPHNYVQAAFQPLPGMHELKQRILIKKAREEAIARGEDPDAAEARILNGGAAPVEIEPAPEPAPAPVSTGLEGGAGLNLSAQGWDWDSLGMGATAPAPPVEQPIPHDDLNNGMGWSNQHGGDADMFSMWMDELGEDRSSDADDNVSVASMTSSDRDRRRRERKNIARELLDTEDKYVKMLEALLATIIRPCLGQSSSKTSPLSKDDANELFGTLRAEEILAINTAFREQLRGRMANLSDETCFGDLFKRFAPFLKMYVEYCTQHENTASRVSLLAAKNDKFSSLLQRARSDPRCQDLDAQSLLIMPIQRIPRYKLLLEGMLKNTEKEHADRPYLQTAIEQISDVASFINDSIKRRENQAKIWDLQAMLSEPIDLATPTRIFIRSGVLTKLGRRYQDREDFFALFNDGLLHAKPATFGTKYVFKRIDPVLQVENVGFLKDKPKALHPFRVVTKGHIYLLAARSAALKQDWIKVLDMAIRGGKRELIHKGPLRVLAVGKEGGVRLAYFYVFNDVVVRGKTLWKGKFKHKETLDVTSVDTNFMLDGRHEALLPKDMSTRTVHEQTFRIWHKHGSVIVIANSDTDKALWLSALDHMQERKRNSHIGTVSSNKRIVHEDNFADLDDSTHGGSQASSTAAATTSTALDMKPPSASGRHSGSRSRSPSVEQRRRGLVASTFGVGSIEELGYGKSSSAPMKTAGARDRRKADGSPRVGPLETTAADLLVALESSDEEDDRSVPIRAPASGVRTSLPRQHHQHHQSQTTQMQPIEGRQPSLSNGALGAGRQGRGAGASTSLVSSNSNRVGGGGAGGQSLLDRDLMAVFSAHPAPAGSDFQSNSASFAPAGNSRAAGTEGTTGFGPSFSSPRLNGLDVPSVSGGPYVNGNPSGMAGSGSMPRSRSATSSGSSSMPLLQPPARDTPPFRSSHNIARPNHSQNHTSRQPAGAGPVSGAGTMVLYGTQGSANQGTPQQQPGPQTLVMQGGGQTGRTGMQRNIAGGYDPFQVPSQGHFPGVQQNANQVFGRPAGEMQGVNQSFGGGGAVQQGFGRTNQTRQQQQQFQQQPQLGFAQQLAPQQQQQPLMQPQQQQQPQQFLQRPMQMQYPQHQQQLFQQQSSGGGQQSFHGF